MADPASATAGRLRLAYGPVSPLAPRNDRRPRSPLAWVSSRGTRAGSEHSTRRWHGRAKLIYPEMSYDEPSAGRSGSDQRSGAAGPRLGETTETARFDTDRVWHRHRRGLSRSPRRSSRARADATWCTLAGVLRVEDAEQQQHEQDQQQVVLVVAARHRCNRGCGCWAAPGRDRLLTGDDGRLTCARVGGGR